MWLLPDKTILQDQAVIISSVDARNIESNVFIIICDTFRSIMCWINRLFACGGDWPPSTFLALL